MSILYTLYTFKFACISFYSDTSSKCRPRAFSVVILEAEGNAGERLCCQLLVSHESESSNTHCFSLSLYMLEMDLFMNREWNRISNCDLQWHWQPWLLLLSGKFIVGYVPTCQEKEYYLACACQEIYAPPSAYFSLYGLTVQASFLGGNLFYYDSLVGVVGF